ncbi:MAG: helix-turn-helix domain-containing protein [Lachnospiraceae bacterium]|nr:helix-turn-helix domain-containing protein [Lachnospiraceae bacterium]
MLLFFLSGCNTLSYISQRELEDMAGVKQSVIARMESGKTDPQLSTILKLLVSMGKTLTIFLWSCLKNKRRLLFECAF